MRQPLLSIVIPAYNEESRIGCTLEQVVNFLANQGFAWEIVVADDGSNDGTAGIVRHFSERREGILLLSLPHRGKGWAVKNGMLMARGQYRFLCDADLSMPIEQVERFLPPHRLGVDIGVGSREVTGAQRIGEPSRRHLMGRFYNWLVRFLAVPGIKDTQCGFKCFRGEVADCLFPIQTIDGFSFDVEVLYLARKAGLLVQEIPIDWHYREASKVRPLRDAINMSLDLLTIRWRDWRGRYRQVKEMAGRSIP